MTMRNALKTSYDVLASFLHQPRLSLRLLERLPYTLRGFEYGQRWKLSHDDQSLTFSNVGTVSNSSNPLRSHFDSHQVGRGIWKWIHYFDIYHHYFSRFVGREVNVLEIGVFSGGSLGMWREYFGPKCHVYGVDIEESCKLYEDNSTKIFIGDQADRGFWKRLKKKAPIIDIVIDDGGHQPVQQIVTLEEMLPHLRSGGIYLCEDVHGEHNQFSYYVQGLIAQLNSSVVTSFDRENGTVCSTTPFQTAIYSIHSYPFVTVIERNDKAVEQFIAPKHGSEWQPFL